VKICHARDEAGENRRDSVAWGENEEAKRVERVYLPRCRIVLFVPILGRGGCGCGCLHAGPSYKGSVGTVVVRLWREIEIFARP